LEKLELFKTPLKTKDSSYNVQLKLTGRILPGIKSVISWLALNDTLPEIVRTALSDNLHLISNKNIFQEIDWFIIFNYEI